jgi:hypothetical protein
LPGLPAGARAAQLVDGTVDLPGGFLELFGKPVRESACECERSNTMMLGPVLAMVNGPIVGDAIRDPNNHISKLVAAEKVWRPISTSSAPGSASAGWLTSSCSSGR